MGTKVASRIGLRSIPQHISVEDFTSIDDSMHLSKQAAESYPRIEVDKTKLRLL
jgi:hypothetical protein